MSKPNYTPPGTPPDDRGCVWRKKTTRSGHSLKVVIPSAICKELGLGQLSEVVVYLVGKTMCVERARDSGWTPQVRSVNVQQEEAHGEA